MPKQPTGSFLSLRSHVVLCLARRPGLSMSGVAEILGVSERTIQAIVAELTAEGYLRKQRVGRRNFYAFDPAQSLRHPSEAHRNLGDLLEAFSPQGSFHIPPTLPAPPIKQHPTEMS